MEEISHANLGCLNLDHVDNISVTVDMVDGSSLRIDWVSVPPTYPVNVEDLYRFREWKNQFWRDLNSNYSLWNSRVIIAKGR